ncbi:right-handed parallel beta-helix repeat-containing protein [Naasia lichenicola]|uniref:Right-handed parallel beta-helix repeat-containing protein n=1 Tax=Naasia lichenicola TaxID=2565933 RepID=A0A4S4FL65_9MICO|nr:right-handed parallel beta-helix repeat-containing protein [Naasia lichenicola]THG30794.1 right-handed parallel beta-helix repeat-containing protein [Naasia lichenicola]
MITTAPARRSRWRPLIGGLAAAVLVATITGVILGNVSPGEPGTITLCGVSECVATPVAADGSPASDSTFALVGMEPDRGRLTVSNEGAIGATALRILGFFDSADPSRESAAFTPADPSLHLRYPLASGQAVSFSLPLVPSNARSVLVELGGPSPDGPPMDGGAITEAPCARLDSTGCRIASIRVTAAGEADEGQVQAALEAHAVTHSPSSAPGDPAVSAVSAALARDALHQLAVEGRPVPRSVGVPSGTALTRVDGDIRVTQAGTVLDKLDIHGRVIVEAPDVTIIDSIVRGRDEGSRYGLVNALAGQPGLRIIDSEIVATVGNYTVNGIMGYNFELTRVDIHGVVDNVHVTGGDVVIADSYLHGNLHYADDPTHADGSHDDNIQIQTGDNILITGNRMRDAHNAAVQITQDQGPVSNVTIAGNDIDNGGCSINISEKGRGAIVGLTITDNRFGLNMTVSRCGVVGPPSTVIDLSRNTFTDGSVVSVLRG